MKNLIFFSLLIALFANNSFSQVGINSDNSAPASSAQLDIKSTNKGLLIPRMTTSERIGIPSPEIGLMVYDLTLQEIYLYNLEGWKQATISKLPLTLEVTNTANGLVVNSNYYKYPPTEISAAGYFNHTGAFGSAIYAQNSGNAPTIIAKNLLGSAMQIETSSSNTAYFTSNSGVAISSYTQTNTSIFGQNNSTTYPTAKFTNLGGGQALELTGDIALNGKILLEPYQYPTFQNNWVNEGGDWNTAKFYKDKQGIVHIEGVIRDGTNNLIFTLPVGYRPMGRSIFTISSASGWGKVDILANGEVIFSSGSMAIVSLDGITFRAQ